MRGLFTRYRGYSLLACALLLILLTALLQRLPAWRLDLTEEKLYSLGEGSRQLLQGLEEPVTLSLYFSSSLAGDLPQVQDYARRIEDLLREYRAINPRYLQLQVVDPEPFSEAEDRVTAAGLQGAPITLGGDSLYLGLIARAGDRQEVLRFFNPDRERFLEYDITQTLYRLTQSRPPRVAVLSPLPLFGGYDVRRRSKTGPWAVIQQLQQIAEVQELVLPLATLAPADADVLLLVHPQELDERSRYAVEQFVLGGGRTMIFVDPQAEIDSRTPGQVSASDLPQLLRAWGVDYSPQEVILDRARGLRLATSQRGPSLPHPGIAGLTGEDLNADAVLTAELDTVNIAASGRLLPISDRGLQFEALLSSSADSRMMSAEAYAAVRDHGRLLLNFEPDSERKVVLARVSGHVRSIFDVPPPLATPTVVVDDDDEPSAATPDAGPTALPTHLAEGDIQVLVFADVDLLSDRMWVQVSNFIGESTLIPWASNGDLITNSVESLAGSGALIGLRSRGRYARPFYRLDKLRAQAAAAFKQQEQTLQLQLQELEQRIASVSPRGDEDLQLMLTDAQRAEIRDFEVQRLQTRRELRQVQRQLNESIEQVQWRLQLVNLLLVPLLLMLTMTAMLVYRRRRAGL
ncbi:GldG family protein [Pseudomaricurvus sp. HS19]|uniref:GldG family protein n=1 Tax=Pseudomaricurvus sp. HS19 TaxID=2692626 RepID=UPI00136FB655|nr:GldG family protein [Pseudomaricurvus sp. HS19]MYM65058.1 hypothetical protein [Pseudomaricurvus sp. HS19]